MRMVRRLLGLAVFVALLVLGWRFANRNPSPVQVDLLFVPSSPHPLWYVLVVAFGVGALAAACFGLYHSARLSLLARRYRRIATGLEGEIHQLRNLPLASQQEGAPRGSAGGPPALGRLDAMDRNR